MDAISDLIKQVRVGDPPPSLPHSLYIRTCPPISLWVIPDAQCCFCCCCGCPQANKYMRAREATAAAGGPVPQALLLQKAATYVTRILSVFGIVDGAADTIGKLLRP